MIKPYLEKIKTTFENLDEKKRRYVLTGVVVFLFLLDYFTFMGPQIGSLTSMGPKIKDLSAQINKTKADSQQIANYRNQVLRLEKRFTESNARFKSKEEVPLILENISRQAEAYGVKIDQIRQNLANEAVVLEVNKRRYLALPITIEARSGYHDMGRFLNKIEQGDIFLTVEAFRVSAAEDSRLHQISLTLSAIIYEDI